MKNISLAKIGAFGLCRRFLYWSCLSFQVSNLCYRREKPQKWHSFQNQFGLVLSLLFYALFSLSAVAQEHEGEGDVEKIDVIGSHIKRTNVEGPSPVLVITREEIEMSGHNSLADVLRDLPVASSGGQREAAQNFPSAFSATSLRGQDSSNTLVLINNRRIAPVGGRGSVSLNTIPLSAVQEVQILKDSSPIYGADAVGGVINIVTKKNQTGGQVNVRGTLVQRKEGNSLESFGSLFDFWNWNAKDDINAWNGKGDKLTIDASYGGSKNDIDYLVGAQLRFNSSMYLSDRSFGQPDKKHRNQYGPIGNWTDSVDGAKGTPLRDCPSEDIFTNSKGKWCYWDYSPYMQFMPRMLQGSVFAQVEKDINDHIRLSSTALYDYTNSWSQLAPPPLRAKMPIEIAKNMGIPVKGTKDITVNYRPVYEKGAGPRRTNLNIHTYQLQFVGVANLIDTMELESALSLSGTHFLSESEGLMQKKTLYDMIRKGELNFILPNDKKSDISKAKHSIFGGMHSNLISFEPKLRGEMVQTETQSLLYAVGGLGAWQRYSSGMDEESTSINDDDKDSILGGTVIDEGVGDRWFGGIYGELSLFSFDMFETNLAVRTDYYYYSDSEDSSGFTEQVLPFTEDTVIPISPRLALSFQPIEEVKIRASWGLGFKAPSLESIYQEETTAYPSSIDYKNCPVNKYDKNNTDCAKGQHEVTAKGVTTLKPETFQSLNIGLVLQPVDLFSLSADYFMTQRKDIVIHPFEAIRNIMLYEAEHGAEALKKHGVIFKRNPSSGAVDNIETSSFNGKDKTYGVDLTVDFAMPVGGAWDLGLKIEHIHMLYKEISIFAGSTDVSIPWYKGLADLFGLENADPSRPSNAPDYGAPRWRNRATFSAMNKNMGHKFDLTLHNIPGQGTLPESKEETDYHWYLDLVGNFTLNKQTKLIVGVRNIFDTERPENRESYGSAGYLSSALYSIRGRTIDARLTYNF